MGQVPDEGALFGIDFGTKRIGIAISNPEQTMSMPLENYTLRKPDLDAVWLRQLARGYGVRGLVIGLPVHMSGDEGGKAKQAREFGRWAAEATGLPVTWWDERYSSSVADMRMDQSGVSKNRRKNKRDQLAAQVILQSFIDAEDRDAPPSSFTD
ncbi:MAG: Holliday junction resolvase RuvX [Planctomycetaceae bacterium]|nr:Holliday junction resolvase RuvX [Planctomycetaceae bacterium]